MEHFLNYTYLKAFPFEEMKIENKVNAIVAGYKRRHSCFKQLHNVVLRKEVNSHS